jgi:uncharacterized protein involved in outer membrane biogenesis
MLRILLIVLPVLALLLLAVALLVLPRLAADRLALNLKEKHGLELAVQGSSGLSIVHGLAATFGNVAISESATPEIAIARIDKMTVPLPISSLFTRAGLRHVILEDAIFTFDAKDDNAARAAQAPANIQASPSAKPFRIEMRNASVKANDPERQISISATDVSGEVVLAEDKSLSANLRGLLNGGSTVLQLNVDDIARLRQKGSPADVTLTSGAHTLVLTGRLGIHKALTFDGSVAAESPDLRSFLRWLGFTTAGFAMPTPVALDAGLSISKSQASFSNLAFALANMQAKGTLVFQAANPRPLVTANLAFNALDLGFYAASADNGPVKTAPDLTQEWQEKPFDVSDLKRFDAKVSLTTEAVSIGAVAAGPATVEADIVDGAVVAKITTQALYGGSGKLDFSLTSEDRPQLALKIDVSGAEARLVLAQAFGIRFLEGPVTLMADVKANGQNVAQLISTLSGTTSLSLNEGTVDGLNMAAVAGLVARNDIEGWGTSAGEVTTLTNVAVAAILADGIATLNNSSLKAAGISAEISGTIDLLRRALDVHVKPMAAGGSNVPLAFRVRGLWDKPKLTAKLDAGEVLRSMGEEDVANEVEELANSTAKKAKKTLKKLFGN